MDVVETSTPKYETAAAAVDALSKTLDDVGTIFTDVHHVLRAMDDVIDIAEDVLSIPQDIADVLGLLEVAGQGCAGAIAFLAPFPVVGEVALAADAVVEEVLVDIEAVQATVEEVALDCSEISRVLADFEGPLSDIDAFLADAGKDLVIWSGRLATLGTAMTLVDELADALRNACGDNEGIVKAIEDVINGFNKIVGKATPTIHAVNKVIGPISDGMKKFDEVWHGAEVDRVLDKVRGDADELRKVLNHLDPVKLLLGEAQHACKPLSWIIDKLEHVAKCVRHTILKPLEKAIDWLIKPLEDKIGSEIGMSPNVKAALEALTSPGQSAIAPQAKSNVTSHHVAALPTSWKGLKSYLEDESGIAGAGPKAADHLIRALTALLLGPDKHTSSAAAPEVA